MDTKPLYDHERLDPYSTYGQYCRVEDLAGGLHTSTRAFIRAAHTMLTARAKTRAVRETRHRWLRSLLIRREAALDLVARFRL